MPEFVKLEGELSWTKTTENLGQGLASTTGILSIVNAAALVAVLTAGPCSLS